MGRYKLHIEYLGTNYHGWQIQPELKTVQETIMKSLETVHGPYSNFMGSGRTDAGVHARGQVAHFDSDKKVDLKQLRASLNGILPEDIAINAIQEAHPEFHARFDGRFRRYHYQLCNEFSAFEQDTRTRISYELSLELMNECSQKFVGEHHFGSFCRTASSTENKVCKIFLARWLEEDRLGHFRFEIVGNRFLHGMVRTIVGTLLEIGRGYRDKENIDSLMKANDRRLAGPAVPAKGLILEEVGYKTWTPDV